MAAKFLLVIAGPTAVGKTKLAIDLALHYSTEIISADSRQFYKEISIGTAKASDKELETVPHHFINNISITNNYTVSDFEQEVISKLNDLFLKNDIVVLCGGSGLFIQAILQGFDEMESISEGTREKVISLYKNNGLLHLQEEVKRLDPEFYSSCDTQNPQRLMRALEVCLQTGKKYSSFRQGKTKLRDFIPINILLNSPREVLYAQINKRVDAMMQAGLLEEVKSVLPYRNHNALNTVGYKELFDYLDGKCSLEEATAMVKQNTRRYAKRQLTWFNNKGDFTEFAPNQKGEIIQFISQQMNSYQ